MSILEHNLNMDTLDKVVFPEFVFKWRWRPPRNGWEMSHCEHFKQNHGNFEQNHCDSWMNRIEPICRFRIAGNITYLRVGSCQYPWYAEISHCFMGSNLKITEDIGGLRKWLNNQPTLWFFQGLHDVWWFPLQKSPEHVAHHQMNSFRSEIPMNWWDDPDIADLECSFEIDGRQCVYPTSRSFKNSAIPIESQPLAAACFSFAKVVTTCPPSTSEIRYWSCWVHRRWWDRIRYTPVPMLLVSRCSWA